MKCFSTAWHLKSSSRFLCSHSLQNSCTIWSSTSQELPTACHCTVCEGMAGGKQAWGTPTPVLPSRFWASSRCRHTGGSLGELTAHHQHCNGSVMSLEDPYNVHILTAPCITVLWQQPVPVVPPPHGCGLAQWRCEDNCGPHGAQQAGVAPHSPLHNTSCCHMLCQPRSMLLFAIPGGGGSVKKVVVCALLEK